MYNKDSSSLEPFEKLLGSERQNWFSWPNFPERPIYDYTRGPWRPDLGITEEEIKPVDYVQ